MSTKPLDEKPIEIFGSDFIEIWSGLYRGHEGYEQYYNDSRNPRFVVFRNHKIIDDIDCHELKNLPGLYLANTRCENIFISNCELSSILVDEKSSINYIDIEKSKINLLKTIRSSQLNSISAHESSIQSLFTSLKSHVGDIELSDSTLYQIRIDKESVVDSIDLYKSSSQKLSVLRNSTLKYLHTQDVEIRDIRYQDSINTNSIYLNKIKSHTINLSSSSIDDLIMNESQVDSLYLIRSEINKVKIHFSHVLNTLVDNKSQVGLFSLSYSDMNNTSVQNGTKIKVFDIHDLTDKSQTLTIEGCCIGEMSVDIKNPFSISVKEYSKNKKKLTSQIDCLDLDSTVFPQGAYLHLSGVSINDINFVSFINEGTIILNGIIPSVGKGVGDDKLSTLEVHNNFSIIEITDSDLGNTQFIGCDLAAFDDFEFRNSKMLNAFFADTTLPKRKKITTDIPENTSSKNERIKTLEQQKLAMSQFKKVYENQGDIVNATKFRGQELEAYSRYLVKSGFLKNIIEIANLWMNKLSGNYANNWALAACVSLTVNWLFFWWYCSELGFTIGDDKALFRELFSYSFEFLNPIRRHSTLVPDVVKDGDITSTARVIDYVSRIFIAYFVYQTIQAFRKFGKKSV